MLFIFLIFFPTAQMAIRYANPYKKPPPAVG